jgi:hypothetical protein
LQYTDDESQYYTASSNNEKTSNLGIGYLEKTYSFSTSTEDSWVFEGMTQLSTTMVPSYQYSLLTYNDNNYLTYTAPTDGQYSYQRFEIEIDETIDELSYLEINWTGRGTTAGAASTAGYVVYFWNFTSSSWVELTSYSGGTTKGSYSFSYTDDFSNLVNSTGYVYVLARSFEARATGGGPSTRARTIETDYVHVKTRSDIIPPEVSLNYPDDLKTNQNPIEFNCYVHDDYKVKNVTLYGNWTGTWEENETNSSGINDVNYTFSINIPEGEHRWNCYSCDIAGNCEFSSFDKFFSIDTIPPEVNLIYPFNWENFTGYEIPFFNFSVTDNSPIEKCELYGDWDNSWELKQTYNSPDKGINLNFSGETVEGDEFYLWNINCTDEAGNSAFNSTNFTFSAFLEPWKPSIYSINQTTNDGTGNIILVWNFSNHSYEFEIYYSEDMKTFNYLNKTNKTNYTDDTFSGNKRRYYNVVSVNPIGQNSSENYFGAHVYTLKHDGVSSRNFLGFPTNFSYLKNANETFREINGAVSISTINFTNQEIVYCNEFTCPSSISCTPTSCNFDVVAGESYDVEIDTSGSSEVNWSGVGFVYEPLSIDVGYNNPLLLKNKKWISLYSGTNLIDAEDLFESMVNIDAVTNWREDLQTSEGMIEACLPWSPSTCFMVGENFNLEVEKGYEVSSTAVGTWIQE